MGEQILLKKTCRDFESLLTSWQFHLRSDKYISTAYRDIIWLPSWFATFDPPFFFSVLNLMNKLSKTALPSIHVQGHLDGEEAVGDPG